MNEGNKPSFFSHYDDLIFNIAENIYYRYSKRKLIKFTKGD